MLPRPSSFSCLLSTCQLLGLGSWETTPAEVGAETRIPDIDTASLSRSAVTFNAVWVFCDVRNCLVCLLLDWLLMVQSCRVSGSSLQSSLARVYINNFSQSRVTMCSALLNIYCQTTDLSSIFVILIQIHHLCHLPRFLKSVPMSDFKCSWEGWRLRYLVRLSLHLKCHSAAFF